MPIDSVRKIAFQSLSEGKEKSRLDEERLKKVCSDFEAIFIQQIMKPMRETVLRSDLFGDSPEKDILESLLDQELSKSLAHRGMGLGKILHQQLIKKGRTIPPEQLEISPSLPPSSQGKGAGVLEAGEGEKTSLIR